MSFRQRLGIVGRHGYRRCGGGGVRIATFFLQRGAGRSLERQAGVADAVADDLVDPGVHRQPGRHTDHHDARPVRVGRPGVDGEVRTGRREDQVLDLRRVALGAVEGIRPGGAVGDTEDDERASGGSVGEAAGRLDQHVVRLLVRVACGGVDRILLEVQHGGLQVIGHRTVEDAVECL